MLQSAVVDFVNITKYPLIDYLRKYQTFMNMEFGDVDRFYSGTLESVNVEYMKDLNWLTEESQKISSTFKDFSSKLNRCDFWELMDYLDSLKNKIDKINKYPKFKRTFLSKRGNYTSALEVKENIGSLRTVEDVTAEISGNSRDDNSWIDVMLKNDMKETDWEIDRMSSIKASVNREYLKTSTILGEPRGLKVLGVDIADKIEFADEDLKIVGEFDNLSQKSDILLALNKGDVPENRAFGKNPLIISESVKAIAYAQIVQEIRASFLQNDLFDSVELKSMEFDQGTLQMGFNIKTKYNYEIQKHIEI